MYVKIPIKMSLTGTYHQINHFFKQVGELKRIVNIEDLALDPVSVGAAARAAESAQGQLHRHDLHVHRQGRRAEGGRHVDLLGRWQVRRLSTMLVGPLLLVAGVRRRARRASAPPPKPAAQARGGAGRLAGGGAAAGRRAVEGGAAAGGAQAAADQRGLQGVADQPRSVPLVPDDVRDAGGQRQAAASHRAREVRARGAAS